jgi:hypothetical protein
MISGNFDDSQATGDLWVVAGYLGYANQWDYFEELWGAALRKHDVPYFHMREMSKPSGAFAKWLPPEQHQPEVIAFFTELVSAIRKSGLHMVSSAVWISDLERFNSETSLALQPYPLAAYACMSLAAARYDNLPVTAIFDRVEKVDSKLITARSYADSDRHIFPKICDYVATTPLQKPFTSRDVPALQAADFMAWELRKAHLNMKIWQQLPDRPRGDRFAQWDYYLEWTRQTTGENPVLRKSLDALISKMPVNSVVWDQQQLHTTNDARRGIWVQEGGE